MAIHYPLSKDSIERLNEEFFRDYDTDHWFFKIKMYDTLLENAKEFMEEMGDDEFREKSIESFHQAVESEIVFTFYHITESLFMLIGVCNSNVPWVGLKHIRVSDIADVMREVVIDKDWEDDDLEQIFYPGMKPAEEHDGAKEESLQFIEEYLSRMCPRYLDNTIYNEYKHGMRLSTSGGRIQIAPEKEFMGETGPPILQREGTTHVYLEEEVIEREGSEVYYQLNRVTSGFDYELFLRLCYVNYLLIDQIIRLRQGWGTRTESENGERRRIELNSWNEFDIDEIFDYDLSKKWESKISYPVGDQNLTIG